MCPFCGSELRDVHDALLCDCGYIETEDMSYDEICDMMSKIEDNYDDCPF